MRWRDWLGSDEAGGVRGTDAGTREIFWQM